MWKIIDYSDEYFDEMLEMTIEYYGKENDIANSDFIKHQYFLNPDGNAYIKFAYDFDNKEMAGQYIVIPRDYKVNDKIYKSVLSLNTLTRSSYRGQQVFTKLAEAVYKRCGEEDNFFCYGAPNPNSFPGFMKKLSFINMGEIPLYLKIRNPFRIGMDKLNVKYKYHEKEDYNFIKRDGLQILHINAENYGLFETMWEKVKGKYSVTGVRNADYMKWRYIDIPRRDYVIFMALEKNIPCGYVVGRITEVAGMRCGMIVDFMFESKNYAVGKLLLRSINKFFKKAKIGLEGCLMHKNKEEAEILRRSGFFVCPKRMLPQPFPIIFRKFNSLGDDENTVKDFTNWFFTMGDYDAI